MATPEKKPASTRKPAKRGPTKAAALKALGLTQEDLKAIKDVKSVREEVQTLREQIVAERAYFDQVPDTTGLEDDVSEDAPAPKPEEEPVWYARNLRGVEFRMRLGRQTDKQAPKPLKPRGQRGDMIRLEPGDLTDEYLLANIELNCVEVITQAEAQKVITGQSTNQQTAAHPAKAMLRNPLGQEYAEGAIQGVDQHVDQSVVVAELEPVGGEYGEIKFSRQQRGSFERTTQVDGQSAEQDRQLGGNPHIVSDGFAAARAADAHARRKDLQGPEAGLPAGTRVTVDTPKKVVVPKPKGA